MNKTQKIFLGAVGGIAVLSIIGSAGDTETQKPAVAVKTPAPEKSVKPEPVKPKAVSGPGNPAVYRRINNTKNCSKLQNEFEIAWANFNRGPAGTDQSAMERSYMEAADERMREIGCYA